jgi:23S rRNA (cytidine1920-2'-O)/16S rRNA (cytidine1409-2'-O)-methyltransferase
MAKRKRADQVLVEKGLAGDPEEARRLVMAGKVLFNEQVIIQASQIIDNPDQLKLKTAPQFASRGGNKLQAAFEAFPLSVSQLVCADIGASTGGFTDCLLQNGADKVYAIDVGYGLLDWNLRNDPRVTVLERTNARSLSRLPETIAFFSADVSFISLKKILPTALNWYGPGGGEAVILIKPQFEATREEAAAGSGVIRDPEIKQRILQDILGFARKKNYLLKGLIRSPLLGPEGNSEYLAWLGYPSTSTQSENIQDLISRQF